MQEKTSRDKKSCEVFSKNTLNLPFYSLLYSYYSIKCLTNDFTLINLRHNPMFLFLQTIHIILINLFVFFSVLYLQWLWQVRNCVTLGRSICSSRTPESHQWAGCRKSSTTGRGREGGSGGDALMGSIGQAVRESLYFTFKPKDFTTVCISQSAAAKHQENHI